ncbi:AAA family ATPase [Microbacterium sp. SMR1]|uniref:RAD55 family ATPase n=1 Tax=Microbacterium sp. SMR1 TaxID=1497340 RepID=UPI000DCCC459|nr:AAA family ATPase [Microbacterium sp. SMR1]RAZ34815.1 hypothetical protein DO944_03055 [Microbacterium sp. SMR1]
MTVIDGVDFIATSRESIVAHVAGLGKLVEHDPAEIPTAARDMGASVPLEVYTKSAALDFLFDSAPKLAKEERKALRKKAARAYDKGRRGPRRAFLWAPDAASRRADLDAEKEKQRIRRDARRELDEEELEVDDLADDYADVAALIEQGVERRTPDAGGLRADGVRLAYSGAVNGLVGPPESGKTLVAIAQACDALKDGARVLHVDADHNGAEATLSHYLAADGIEESVLADRNRFRYVDVRSADHLRRIVAAADEWRPTFVVVDSVGEMVPLMGGESNSNDDYRRIHREILSPLANLGAAVLVIDHVTKEEGRGGYAIGAGAKKAAIDGSYLAVATMEPFAPGQGGVAALTILKDRHGGLRAVSPAAKSPTAAVFRLDSRSGVSTWEFYAPRSHEERLSEQLAADVAALNDLEPAPTSKTDVKARMKWGSDRAFAALTAWRAAQQTTFPVD